MRPAVTAGIAVACIAIGVFGHSPGNTVVGQSWSPRKAADYLDGRARWWSAWPGARRDHQTFCVSCHTAVPYALARPVLDTVLHDPVPSAGERILLDNVIKRVHLWNEVQPYYKYGTQKEAESRGTEAVLNALILASYDARMGSLGETTRLALDHMWSAQKPAGNGAWPWLQFDNEPFEGHDSQYYGAALAAIAVGYAGPAYRSEPAIQGHLKLLAQYLNREFAAQSPINHVVLLWASAGWPELVSPDRRADIIAEILNLQHTDGGWNLASLSWSWRDWTAFSLLKMFVHSYGTPLTHRSDGYATGLIAFALQQAGLARDHAKLSRSLSWLRRNQNKDKGLWQSFSLNNRRDPSSATGLFMTDAATAYAVLALTHAESVQ